MPEPHDHVSLREHVAEQIRAMDRYFHAKLEGVNYTIEKAERELQDRTDKASAELSKRLDGMNEFRETLKDQASKLATKDDIAYIEKRLQSLERLQALAEGKASFTTILWSAGLSAAIAIALRLLKL